MPHSDEHAWLPRTIARLTWAMRIAPLTRWRGSPNCFAAQPGHTASCWDVNMEPCDFSGTTWLLYGACCRGTGAAMFDYAEGIEAAAGHVAFLCKPCGESAALTIARFRRRFGHGLVHVGHAANHVGNQTSLVERYARQLNVTHIYALVEGKGESTEALGLLAARKRLSLRLAAHAVFHNLPPYPLPAQNARISYSVGGSTPVVPHIVAPRRPFQGDMRARLGIADNATVFCSYGGQDSFNLQFVRELVCDVAATRAAGWQNQPIFLLANHKPFCAPNASRGVLIHRPALADADKQPFIDSCDAFLHARSEGETFGLAVAEFSVSNKPVLAYAHSGSKVHLEILGNKALLYKDRRALEARLHGFDRARMAKGSWNMYSEYSSSRVMRRFCHIFK